MTAEVAINVPAHTHAHLHIICVLMHIHMNTDTPGKEENMFKEEKMVIHMKGRIRFVHTDIEKTKPWESGFRPHSSDDGSVEAGSRRWAGVHGCEENSLKVRVLCGASVGRSGAPSPALSYRLLQHGSSDNGQGSYSLTPFSSATHYTPARAAPRVSPSVSAHMCPLQKHRGPAILQCFVDFCM